MFKIHLICVMAIVFGLSAGCTDNHSTRVFGGTQDIQLKPNTKLINVTWKGDDMWLLTKPMKQDDLAETHEFKESSSFGILEGTVRIHESKQ